MAHRGPVRMERLLLGRALGIGDWLEELVRHANRLGRAGDLAAARQSAGEVDGLPGGEGTFGICTFWLAECLALAGEVDRARALFDRMAGCANDVGLLAEEVDPATGELLGNFPQAFTHIGLIHAALAIAAAAAAADES